MFLVKIFNKQLNKELRFSVSKDRAENKNEVNQYTDFWLQVLTWSKDLCEVIIEEVKEKEEVIKEYVGFNLKVF